MDNKLAGTNAKCTHRVAENAGSHVQDSPIHEIRKNYL